MTAPETDNDALVQALRHGNPQAHARLYRQCWPLVKNSLLPKSPNRDEEYVKDAYQEAFRVLLENFKKPKFVVTNLYGFILKTSLNCFYASLRRFTFETSGQLIDPTADNDYEMDETEQYERDLLGDYYDEIDLDMTRSIPPIEKAMQAINQLGEKCRNIILDRFYLTDNSWEDLALDYGYTNVVAIRKYGHDCLQRLRVILGVN